MEQRREPPDAEELQPLGGSELEGEPDFAAEHTDLTVAPGGSGGPEDVSEPESPDGYGGMDT